MAPTTFRNGVVVVPGIGQHVTSPQRRSRYSTKAERAKVFSMGKALQTQMLSKRLEGLWTVDNPKSKIPPDEQSPNEDFQYDAKQDQDMPCSTPDPDPVDIVDQPLKTTRSRPRPDLRPERFYERWNAILPSLEESLLAYQQASLATPVPSSFRAISLCRGTECTLRTTNILMLFWDHFDYVEVPYCSCASLHAVLIRSGMFPTSPVDPQMAISIEFLSFYHSLSEHSGLAVTATAGALTKFYEQRGWPIVTSEGKPISDPFRKSLGHAIQWYDILRIKIERNVDKLVHDAQRMLAERDNTIIMERKPQGQQTSAFTEETKVIQCALELQDICGACFGGTRFGRSIDQGGDIHTATDANFSHRHLRVAGDSPAFYETARVLPKSFVDDVGLRIDRLRKKSPKTTYVPKLSDAVVKLCESGLVAADPAKSKTDEKRFDDTGLAALVCRHEIPLFLVNVDTPGEQQKYAIALVEYLFSLLPPTATVVVFYDIGCVLDRSLNLHQLLPQDILGRLSWATAAMHSYTHEWACQLVYGPRFQVGLGLTCGEAVERLWSKLRKIIAITRTSARSRRLWIIDRHVQAIGHSTREELGVWMKRRLARVEKQRAGAIAELNACGVSEDELEQQWLLQKAEQTSIRNHAPARLKKELDTVLSLQAEVGKLETSIASARKDLAAAHVSANALKTIECLESARAALSEQVDHLFASLNVEYIDPNLSGLSLDFMRTLLAARDLKINIRKRCAAQFMEWDRLDQACGGRGVALGTKLHQETRNKLKKRRPALVTSLKKYNSYCAELRRLRPEGSVMHVPEDLPTDLAILRGHGDLMQDVWISPTPSQAPPRWLEDPQVRHGIYAMHRKRRSLEERRRCGNEADNMCVWYGKELLALHVAIQRSENAPYISHLQQRLREHMNRLQKWQTPLVSQIRYDAHLKAAQGQGMVGAAQITWLPPRVCEPQLPITGDVFFEASGLPESDSDDESQKAADSEFEEDPEQILLQDFFHDATDNSDEDEEADNCMSTDQLASNCPMDLDTEDDIIFISSAVDNRPSTLGAQKLEICPGTWTTPENVRFDLLAEIVGCEYVLSADADLSSTRHRGKQDAISSVYFTKEDILQLVEPTAWLNDVCINCCAQLLYERLHLAPLGHHSIAIFSSHDLTPARLGLNSQVVEIADRLECSKKDIWVIPCFKDGHWTLLVVIVSRKLICQYDSRGSQERWKADTADALTLVRIINNLDSPTWYEWRSIPIYTANVQINSDDCGVWVLANMAAIFRGKDAAWCSVQSIRIFRSYLLQLVLDLPKYWT